MGRLPELIVLYVKIPAVSRNSARVTLFQRLSQSAGYASICGGHSQF